MFKLRDFPFTWFQIVAAFTNPAFYMFLKIQMAQITELTGRKKTAATGKNVLTEFA
jgi:hypothetical protein